MADDHLIMLPNVRLTRGDSLERVATVLEDHGFVFDGGMRALHWEAEGESFRYDDEDDRDIEGFTSIEAAISVSTAWERVCLDFHDMDSPWELQASRGATRVESVIALSFPHSLHRLCGSEVPTARRLLQVMNGVCDVLGVEVFACGTETPTPGLSASALDAFVRAELEATQGDPTPRMHTLVLTAAAERALDASTLLSEAWHRLQVAPGVTALSLALCTAFT